MSSIAFAQLSSALGLEESSVYYSALLSTLSTGHTFLLSLFHLLSLLSSPFLNLSLIIFKHLKPHIILTLSNTLEYERELSNELKAIQLLLLLFLLTCYMLKRYIQRKRYIPRLTSYLSSFQTHLKTHYKNFIKKVHNINSTLAFILPHITYILICLTSWKYLKPQVTWLSSGWMVPLISVVYPVFGTVSVLRGRLRVGLNWKPEIKEEVVGGSKTKKINKPSTPENLKNLGFTSPMTSPILRVGGGKRTKSFGGPNAALRLESDSDVIAAIQYWTVYGVVTSVYTGLSYLPVLAKYVVHYQGLSSPIKFFFFAWLHLPFEGTEVIYRYACPLALRFADGSNGEIKNDSVMSFINKLTSLIGLMHMVGLCGPKTRDRVNIVLRESLSVVPSVVCLGMPGYFTRFGVVWSSLLVPSANSARGNRNFENDVVGAEEIQTRWLKYWCVYATTSGVLHYLEPVLSWVPFSTHAVLVLFMAMSLPGLGVCEFLFQIIVNEAVGWGVISGEGFKDVGETMVVRGIRAVSRAEKMRGEKKKKMEEEGEDKKGVEKKEEEEETIETKKNK